MRDEEWRYLTPTHADPSPQTVTVIHPYHPLKGQQVTIVRIRNGADPDLIVRLPDGTHAALTMSATDLVNAEPLQGTLPLTLLDPQGLHQIARLVQRLLARQTTAPPSPERSAPAISPTPE